MAYRMTSPSQYPFHRENAKFFSQDLFENVLLDFGLIWKPVRTMREIKLRRVASFIFIPPIGRLVSYISRKYSRFVVTKSFDAWRYINAHRESVRERMLTNEIICFCTRSEFENNDLGLFTFLAIVTEYARLVITHEQENLVDTVVNALTYCLTCKLSRGFILTLDRMISFALNFDFSLNVVAIDYYPQSGFVTPINTDTMYTPRSEFQSPLRPKFQCSPSDYCAPPDDIKEEIKFRKIHRELFRLKMMTDCATQTEMKSSHSISQLQSLVLRSSQTGLAEKVEIKKYLLDTYFEQADIFIVETKNVSVQTWSYDSGEEPGVTPNETLKIEGNIPQNSASKYAKDLNIIIEKLKELEKLQANDVLPSSTRFSTGNLETEKPEEEKSETEDMNIAPQVESLIVQKPDTDIQSSVYYACSDSFIQLQESGESDQQTCARGHRDHNQFESLETSTDNPEHCPERKNYTFDSPIGSLDESQLKNF